MPTPLKILSVSFPIPLQHKDVNWFRSTVIKPFTVDNPELFHSLQGEHEKVERKQAKVWFRCVSGMAAIVAVNEGADAVQAMLKRIKKEKTNNALVNKLQQWQLSQSETHLTYTRGKARKHYWLHHWVAMRTDRYRQYNNCSDAVERIHLLQELLTAHIKTLLRELNFNGNTDKLQLTLFELQSKQVVRTQRSVKRSAFDLEFTSNIILPDYLALGLDTAEGYGWVEQKRNENAHLI